MRQFNNLTPHKSLRDYAGQAIKSKGVSLIEMLAAVAIFAITVGAISGIFVSTIRTQRRILAIQELLDQTSYVLEYMGRALRMAKKDSDGTCISVGNNYENPSGISTIKFIAIREGGEFCWEFSRQLDGTVYRIQERGKIGTAEETTSFLTSNKLQVNSLKFNLSGEPGSDTLQPRVTIFLEILGRGTTERPEIQIQTSISQRPLDAP